MNCLEKRRNTRIPLRARVSLKFRADETVESESLDISRGGVLLDSPIPLNSGHTVQVQIRIGSFQLEPVKGFVLRSSPAFWGYRHLVAVEFEQENQSVLEALEFHLTSG